MGVVKGLGTLLVVGVFAAGTIAASGTMGVDPSCEGLERVVVAVGEVLCTHGDDIALAPEADDPTRTSGAMPSTRERCHEGGVEGARVQVLYLHATNAANRLRSLRPDVLRWSRQVEWTVVESARRRGGVRHVRWVTKQARDGRCTIDVRAVAVPAADLDEFGSMISALRRDGWDERDRKYLLFVDDDTYCGLGTAPRDDRPGTDNVSERRTGYARVDRRCWDTGDRGFGSTAAHELLHTLGAVQDSAPHASGRAHCTDEYDLLCYDDGAGTTTRCRDASSATAGSGDHHNRLLDCGGDDYFHPSPRAGSYLDSHWNTARSSFLASHGSDGPGYGGTRQAADPDEEPTTSEEPLVNRVVGDVLDQVATSPASAAGDVSGPTAGPQSDLHEVQPPRAPTLITPGRARRPASTGAFAYLPWWDR